MEMFDAGWLMLREPVDHGSRADALLDPLGAVWRVRRWYRVLDLGSGTGSNLRYLAPRLPPGQEWVLVEYDLGHVRTLSKVAVPTAVKSLSVVAGDLTNEGLRAIATVDLVTASALLDLVSEEWLNRLVNACADGKRGAHFALSYDGKVRWLFTDDRLRSEEENLDDVLVLEGFNLHQTIDKGLGPALGPCAGQVAERLFRAAGYQTRLLSSPWQLGNGQGALVRRLIDGWASAAAEVLPKESDRIHAWAERRRTAVSDGQFSLTVGHCDLLALPPE